MAAKKFRGNILLELLVVLMALLLIAVLIVPNKIWEEENRITETSRNNMNELFEAERFYYKTNEVYVTDSLSKLLEFVRTDSSSHMCNIRSHLITNHADLIHEGNAHR